MEYALDYLYTKQGELMKQLESARVEDNGSPNWDKVVPLESELSTINSAIYELEDLKNTLEL